VWAAPAGGAGGAGGRRLALRVDAKQSLIGKKPVAVPKGVDLKLSGQTLSVKGPLGSLERTFPEEIKVSHADESLVFQPVDESRRAKQMHGLSRTLGQNMITGVAEGWSKQLKLVGVGYRAEANPKAITLSLGYSHPVVMEIPEGLKVEVAKGNTDITVSGIDKEQVGNFAANMRKKRPPEPYKGKGVRYADEYVPLKEGKAGKA